MESPERNTADVQDPWTRNIFDRYLEPEELDVLLDSPSDRDVDQTTETVRSSLPSQYEPYQRQHEHLIQTVRAFKEARKTAAPRYSKAVKYVWNSTYLKRISPLFGYFWLTWQRAHGATMFLLDLALLIYALTFVSGRQVVSVHGFSTVQIAHWIGVPFYIQTALPFTTWVFGYIGPRESTYTAHTTIAGIRAVSAIGCFLYVYFRKNFGIVRPAAIKLVSILVLAALAHLIGACIRIVQFTQERSQALRNPSDRRIHEGNGFTISYLSLEDQEKQKAAARARVGIHQSFVDTLDKYWHCPTPELDVSHSGHTAPKDVAWWRNPWLSRTALQQHVKRVAYMRKWPLSFEAPALLHDELFAHCDCCLARDGPPEALPDFSEDLPRMRHRREEFKHWAVRGERATPQQPLPDGQEPPHRSWDGLLPNVPSVPLHGLCERCESLCCASRLFALLVGNDTSRFWPHIKAAFTFTHAGPLLEESFMLWESSIALRDSAYAGCHLCSMVWNSLSPPQQKALVREVNAYAHTDVPKDLGVSVKILSPYGWRPGRQSDVNPLQQLYLVTHFGRRRVARFWMEEKFVLRAQSLGIDPLLERPELLPPMRVIAADPADVITFAPPSSSLSTGSPAAMDFAMRWLCAHQHTSRVVGGTNAPRNSTHNFGAVATRGPKRLLEIKGKQVWLVCEESLTRVVPYVALSYCWHSTHKCVLQVETVPYYMNGVDVDDLPPTIREATRVTQSLSFNYIWIDALCIIQDSEEDKNAQLQDMHSIFAGAAFVIAAAAAMDSSQGFLVDQMPQAMSACLLNLDQDFKTVVETCERVSYPGTALVALPSQTTDTAMEHELALSRLKSRGWVYQEEELAARVLYFCDRQMVLRCNLCRKTAAQKCLPSRPVRKVPNTMWIGRMSLRSAATSAFRALRNLLLCRGKEYLAYDGLNDRMLTCMLGQVASLEGRRMIAEEAALPSTQQERWWKLVAEYSSRHLSYAADKLPAIQGLADRFESELHASLDLDSENDLVRYAHGLWTGDALKMGLLWYVRDGTTIRPAKRAPSWSWAAVDGVIGHDSVTGHTLKDACGVTVLFTPDSHDPSLVLEALVKPATWHRAPDNRKMYYVGHRRQGTVRFQHDLNQYEPLTMDLSQGPEAQILRDLSGRDIGYLILDSSSDHPTEGSEIHCLRVVVKPATRKGERDFNVPWATRGLALVTTDKEPRTYRRIGYFELQRTPGGISYRSSMNPAKQKAERSPPPNIDVTGFFDDCELSTVRLV